jgi:hypothetical protein
MTHPTTDTDSIAAGVPMYSRETALERFLESVPPSVVDAVYVADNGPPDEQDRDLYARAWPFDLTVLYLDHDVGIGPCRHRITEAAIERDGHDYLWVGDCDMRIRSAADIRTLRRLLAVEPELGGASGWLIEGNTVRSGARDMHLENGVAIKDGSRPSVEENADIPFARFEFIPQAGLFRAEALADYSWDPEMQNTEHLDFFLAHKHRTDWEFASTPAVMTFHDRDIDEEYRESRGKGHVDEELLQSKWGVRTTVPGVYMEWDDGTHRSVTERAFDLFRERTSPRVWLPIRRGLKGVLR